ncbi:hypothetical protein AAY473_011437 [Plecturocebus cupreus]
MEFPVQLESPAAPTQAHLFLELGNLTLRFNIAGTRRRHHLSIRVKGVSASRLQSGQQAAVRVRVQTRHGFILSDQAGLKLLTSDDPLALASQRPTGFFIHCAGAYQYTETRGFAAEKEIDNDRMAKPLVLAQKLSGSVSSKLNEIWQITNFLTVVSRESQWPLLLTTARLMDRTLDAEAKGLSSKSSSTTL